MKIFIIIAMLLTCLTSFGQVTPSKTVKVNSSVTVFNENISKGTVIIDQNSGKQYLTLLALASAKTIATCTLGTDIRELAALSAVEPTIATGTTLQYWRGDKSWQTLPIYTTFPGFGLVTGKAWGYDSHPTTLAGYGVTDTPWTGYLPLGGGTLTGALGFKTDVWQTSNDLVQRLYFASGSHTYMKTSADIIFRNASDQAIFQSYSNGNTWTKGDAYIDGGVHVAGTLNGVGAVFTSGVVATQFMTGANTGYYFGDANHGMSYGAAGSNALNFVEYGGVFNFNKQGVTQVSFIDGAATFSSTVTATKFNGILGTTHLGQTGDLALDIVNTSSLWSNLPIGYSGFINSNIAGGAPENNLGYFTKVANRDMSGGWSGIWISMDGSSSSNYIGRTSIGASFAQWDKLYSDKNLTNTLTNKYLPKWNGSSLVNSMIFENNLDETTFVQNGSSVVRRLQLNNAGYSAGIQSSNGDLQLLYNGYTVGAILSGGVFSTMSYKFINSVNNTSITSSSDGEDILLKPSTSVQVYSMITGLPTISMNGRTGNVSFGGSMAIQNDVWHTSLNDGTQRLFYSSYAATYIKAYSTINFRTGNTDTDKMTLDASGNLAVSGSGMFTNDITTSGGNFIINKTGGGLQIRLNSAGTYYGAIGNPANQVWGLGYSSGSDFVSKVTWDVSGNVIMGGTATASNFILSSDSTLKKDIKPLSFKKIPINFYSFSFKSDPTNENRYGVIAQEVEKYDPSLVLKENGKLKVKYIDLIMLMLSNQKHENEALQEKISSLEKRLENIEKLLK